VARTLQVDRPDPIDLVELVGGPGLRARVFLAWQERGEADPGKGQAVALQDALDGPLAEERVDARGLQLGADGRGADQAVARRRRGMGLEPAADGEDGPLQLGPDAPGRVAARPRRVVEALGAGLPIAVPSLVEPRLAATRDRADLLDGSAGETETDGAPARREFVAHDVLRGATAGGYPRGTF